MVLKGAGRIGPTVREFITNELNIRVEVPALELLHDATLVGGLASEASEDVLLPQRPLAETDPDIVLGPDSVGTLSFTSGSTGIPKGVRGRHYSLTHFFPWMGQRFGLDENSKFTMLSGIAHDPIQRDSESIIIPPRGQRTDGAQCSHRYSSAQGCTSPRQMILELPDASRSGWRTTRSLSRISHRPWGSCYRRRLRARSRPCATPSSSVMFSPSATAFACKRSRRTCTSSTCTARPRRSAPCRTSSFPA